MRESNHLRDNERAVPGGVRSGSVLPPIATIRAHQREMERASRVQLQQHTNGAQPSVTGGIEDRPSGHVGKPWRKISSRPSGSQSTGPVQAISPATESVSFGPKATNMKFKKSGSQLSVGTTSDMTLRNPTMGSQQSIESRSIKPKLLMTTSQTSLGPKVTRFQIDQLKNDKQTKV